MIDVMSLRQSYKWREIIKVKRIHGYHNLADSITKSKFSSALRTLIYMNRSNINTTEWVEQVSIKQAITST